MYFMLHVRGATRSPKISLDMTAHNISLWAPRAPMVLHCTRAIAARSAAGAHQRHHIAAAQSAASAAVICAASSTPRYAPALLDHLQLPCGDLTAPAPRCHAAQVTAGACTSAKPWGWNAIESAKWNSWMQLGDMGTLEAMALYVATMEVGAH